MTQENFTAIVVNPAEITQADVAALETLTERFPYCSLSYSLLAKGLYGIPNHDQATDRLTQAAAYALSRNALRKLINGELLEEQNRVMTRFDSSKGTTNTATIPHDKTKDQRQQAIFVDNSGLVPIEINSFQALRGIDYSETLLSESIANKPFFVPTDTQQGNWALIDKFIENQPRIRPIRLKPGEEVIANVEDLAERASPNHTHIITESYAKIQAKVGNLKLAVETYEKLILKFPTKKTYFATKIAEIRSKAENS